MTLLEENRQRLRQLLTDLGSGTAAMVLRHGEWRTVQGQSWLGHYGRFGFCFFNAMQAAEQWDSQLTYWEGYMLIRGELVHHAWVVDRRRRAFDVTWRHENALATAALGIPVPAAVLRGHYRLCGGASFLEDTYHDCPAQRIAVPDWSTLLPVEFERLYTEHCLAEVAAGRATVRPDGSIWHEEHLGPLPRQLEAQAR